MPNPDWATQLLWRQSPKGRASVKRANDRYWASPKGKAAVLRRRQQLTLESIAARKVYEQSPSYKAARKRRFSSPEGKAVHFRCHLRRKYGLTVKEFNEMLTRQKGVCAICARPNPNAQRLFVDHEHTTGLVRGLLCRYCNSLLGLANDDENTLRRAIEYLRRNSL